MKKSLLVFGAALILLGCKQDEEPVLNLTDPTAAQLIFPYENSECNEGTNITATESTVLFEWEIAENTDSYDLILKDLSSSQEVTYKSPENQISIVLLRATPYAWYVVSQSNTVSAVAESETWKFYNAGDGVLSYAPFPAEIISPAMAEIITSSSGEITLDWDGSDVDNDIIGYDLYFGTSDPPAILSSDLQESMLVVPVASDSIYYWGVTTKDEHGNSSESGIYQFKIL